MTAIHQGAKQHHNSESLGAVIARERRCRDWYWKQAKTAASLLMYHESQVKYYRKAISSWCSLANECNERAVALKGAKAVLS